MLNIRLTSVLFSGNVTLSIMFTPVRKIKLKIKNIDMNLKFIGIVIAYLNLILHN